MIKVMIADDQALIRESLQIILSAHQDIQVTSAVADGHEVLERIPQDRPDVVLMDIRMPKMDGVMATKEVKERYPEVKIIILTTFDDDDFIYPIFYRIKTLSKICRFIFDNHGNANCWHILILFLLY